MKTKAWIGWVAAVGMAVAGAGCTDDDVREGGNIVPDGDDHDTGDPEFPSGDYEVARPAPPPGDGDIPGRPDIEPPRDPAGPWPVADVIRYGPGEGLPGNVTGVGVDDGQNVYAIDGNAAYAMAVGKTSFVRTDSGGQFEYGYPVSAVCGGEDGKVYLGFMAPERPVTEEVTEEQKLEGDFDRMVLQADGSLALEHHYQIQNSAAKWMDHTRMMFDCARVVGGPNHGDLYITSNHGATVIRGDEYADHRHAVWKDPVTGSLAIGYIYGANTDPAGNFYFAGYWKLAVVPPAPSDLMVWLDHQQTKWIQDTYAQNLGSVEDPDELHAIAGDAAKGRLFVGSWGKGLSAMEFAPRAWWSVEGTPDSFINSLELDPTDGKLWVATQSRGLWRYDESTGTWEQSPHVPSNARVNKIYLDTTVEPRALYAATNSGLYVIRAK